MRTLLASLPFLASASFASLLSGPDELDFNKSYDYIIVGGGAGGSVLANRLSEDIDSKVLLIEAGSGDFRDYAIEVPSQAPQLAQTHFDWNFTTVNMTGVGGRSLPYQRGFVLGGSTSVNYMAYTRGSRDDFDRWARVTGDNGWSWNSLLPYMQKLERYTLPTDRHNASGQLDIKTRGKDGPVGFSVPNAMLATDARIINTTRDLDEFPFNLDYNSGNSWGLVGFKHRKVVGGSRESSATAYIAPALSRPNLDILVNTIATKVIQTDSQYGTPVFRGVQFAVTRAGPFYQLNATREVLLSAGAIKTPQILMLSGIGDSNLLSGSGIDAIVDNPDVGQSLQDHPFLVSSFTVNSTDTLDKLQNATIFANQEELWNTTRTGLLSLAICNQIGFLRLPYNSPVFKNMADPSAGPTSAHYELVFTDSFVSSTKSYPGGNFFSIFTAVVSPTSRGNITLSSASPFDAPLIDPNIYDTEFDRLVAREAIKSARRFVEAPSWNGWIIDEFGAFSQAKTDDEIDQYVRDNTNTLNHISGTVAMGKKGGTGPGNGALNPDLTVKGAIGLRVVDTSAFPFIPSTHVQVPTYVLAERASDLIKSYYL